MEVLPSYLLGLMLSLTLPEHSSAKYIIQDLYVGICDLCFRPAATGGVKAKSLSAIILLYEKFLNRTVDSPSEFHGCGAPYKVPSPFKL